MIKKIGVISLPFALVSAGYAGFYFWFGLPFSIPSDIAAKGQIGDSFGMLNSLFSAFGFAAVVVTLWMQRQQNKTQAIEHMEEVAEQRSLFNLNASIEATARAQSLLEDHNNDRKTWIEAGRLLAHAKALGKEVTSASHKRVLEISDLKHRAFFSDLLKQKNAKFFYGVRIEGGSLDDFARAASAPAKSSNGIASLSQTRYLAEASIFQVWEAAEWPEDFEDPLSQTFSEADRNKLKFRAKGLSEYLDHRDQWSTVAGESREKK